MKKLFALTTLLAALVFNLHAQTWGGSTTSTGNAYRSGNVGVGEITNPTYPFVVVHPTFSIPAPGTNYKIASHIDNFNTYKIPSGMTDLGYRMGMNINTFVKNSDFLGTLSQQIGLRIQFGSFTGAGAGTITNVYGLYLDGLTGGSATMTNRYAIYQTGSTFRNYFQGYIGINTIAPSNQLHVKDGNGIKIQATNAQMELSDAVGTLKLRMDNTGNLQITNSSNASLYHFGKDGKMGIGTIKPTATLTVNGDILAERIDVIGTVPASDFVFEEDYNLRSLTELEAFVKENKHLPEVPSAAEFKENGYSVGEMDDILLRKVEELTLYIIEQQKLFEAQQALIEQLQQKVETLEVK
ncbi:MAG: hypothetical protein IPM71_02255 [Bacteroidota bacterium]|nr:MAG: hypothetical protein IPM71_02255 [Bacteroidota bacterium]